MSRTKLLTGGNPQVPKGDGDEPVQTYIGAMPAWKSAVGAEVDRIVSGVVPGVRKGTRWNGAFYGRPDDEKSWFLAFHCATKFVKLSWFDGVDLRPEPPIAGKDPRVRYLKVFEDDEIDQAQLQAWCEQAVTLAGWTA